MSTSADLNAKLQSEQIEQFNARTRISPSDMLFRFWWVPVAMSLLTSGLIGLDGFNIDFSGIGYVFKDLVPNGIMYAASCFLTTYAIDAYDREIAFHHLGRQTFAQEKLLHLSLIALPILAILLANQLKAEYYLIQISAALIFVSVPLTVGALMLAAKWMRPAEGSAGNERSHLRLPVEVGSSVLIAVICAALDVLLIEVYPEIWQL